MTCSDLRLGGTLSTSGIAGGTSINDTALAVADWSQILGSWGMSAQVQVVNGRPGGYMSGDMLGRERYPTLSMDILDRDHSGGLTEPTWQEQKQANTDEFLALITNPSGNYLEVDMPDGTSRFLLVYNIDPAPIRQPRKLRSISVPLISPMPYWKEGGTQSSDNLSGADTVTTGGNREVYDAVLVFAGDGTITHADGWELEVVGSSGAVTVDLGARTVTQGGNPADNLLRRNNRKWGWFNPGGNSVTVTGTTIGVTWRDSWA